MTARRRQIWLWHSDDGVMVFGTARRAKAYISDLFRREGVKWRRSAEYDDVWEGRALADAPDDEPRWRIAAEVVR